jgi:hypothetical protein
MANPFQGLAQMGVNEFWAGLQQLQTFGNQLKADLTADRTQLMNLYTQARNDSDPVRGAAHMKALDPIVNNNSVLRLKYQDLAAKFNEAVNGASSLLRQAGLSTPTLSGLGIIPVGIVVLGVALLAAATAWGIYEGMAVATAAQRTATASLATIIANPQNYTPAEVAAAADAIAKKAKEANPFDLSSVTPILIGILAIMVAPTILGMVKSRKAAA